MKSTELKDGDIQIYRNHVKGEYVAKKYHDRKLNCWEVLCISEDIADCARFAIGFKQIESAGDSLCGYYRRAEKE